MIADVSYYVHKKQGFPSIKDKGVMDIFLGGSGFSFKAAMETADKKDRNHFFKVNNVTVDVKNMKIKVRQSNYRILFAVVKPLLLRVMRPILQKVLSTEIKKSIDQLDAVAWEIHREAKKAQDAAKKNPDEKSNVYQHYFQAAQKKFTSDKEKKGTKQSKGQVNVAVTQHESIFKDVSLPGGISSKATEFKDLAEKGEKWESPVFGIGSAQETTGIPKVAQVTRKQHNVTPSQVRGTQSLGSSAQPNGTSAFSNQVDGAFAGSPRSDLALKGAAAPYDTNTHTSLGGHNPVLQGSV